MSVLQEASVIAHRSLEWGGGNLQSRAPMQAQQSSGLNARALRCAIAYIDANLGERFSLYDLASSANVSRFHFARLFRVSTGHSPMEYLMRIRIERGQRLLQTENASICEIATQLGFCDQSHFTRTFRRLTGLSPRAYRRLKSL